MELNGSRMACPSAFWLLARLDFKNWSRRYGHYGLQILWSPAVVDLAQLAGVWWMPPRRRPAKLFESATPLNEFVNDGQSS
jgi:hypothetical protein